MTIKMKLNLVGLVFAALLLLLLGATYSTITKQKNDAAFINLAGRQRMLTQKMSKEVHHFLYVSDKQGSPDTVYAEKVRNTVKVMSVTLDALINSGRAPLSLDLSNTEYIQVPAVEEPALSQLKQVNSMWKSFTPVIERVLTFKHNTADLERIHSENVEILTAMNKGVVMMQKASEEKLSRLITIQIICAVIGFVVVGFAFAVFRCISNSIASIVTTLNSIESGKINSRSDLMERKDEIGSLARATNGLAEHFEESLGNMRGASSTLSSSTTVLNRLAGDMSVSAVETASNAKTVTDAAERMNSNMAAIAAATEEASINVNQVASGAEEMTATISEIASNSDHAISITETAVDEAGKAEESVRALGNAARDISKVTETINEIADQTNLLALNATIEAARAGEAGKGFAVVANEIKDLAKQTTEATMEIKERIEGVQGSSEQTIGVINTITSTINQTNEIVTTMATAVQEQAQASREISDNVAQASLGIQEINENIAQASSVNAEVTNDIAKITTESNDVAGHSTDLRDIGEEMAHSAEELGRLIKNYTFRAEPFEIGDIKMAHFDWKMKLTSALGGYANMEEDDIPNHHQCSFGQWCDNAPATLKNSSIFAELDSNHQMVHTHARESISLYNANNASGAQKKFQEFENSRKSLFANLDELYVS